MAFPMLNTRPSVDDIVRLANDHTEINLRKPNRAEAWTDAEEKHLQLLSKWRRGFHTKAGHCYVWALLLGMSLKSQVSEAARFMDTCTNCLFDKVFPVFPLDKGAILGLPTRYWGDDKYLSEDTLEIARREKLNTKEVWTLYRNACLESYELEMTRTFPITAKLAEPMVSVECLASALSRMEDPMIQGPRPSNPLDNNWGLTYNEESVEVTEMSEDTGVPSSIEELL